MKIEQGILSPTTLRPVGQGITGACYAIVYIAGLSHRCVVKPAGEIEIAAECFCALLGYAIGLPTLVPIIVTDPRNQELWFGTREVGYPSLSARFHLVAPVSKFQLQTLANILSNWPDIGGAISFDEIIANGDRNPGNVLWNGSQFTLIDHERSLYISPMLRNKLALFATHHFLAPTAGSVQAASTSAAMAHQAILQRGIPAWVKAEFSSTPPLVAQHYAAFSAFAQNRLPGLVASTASAMSPLFAGNHP